MHKGVLLTNTTEGQVTDGVVHQTIIGQQSTTRRFWNHLTYHLEETKKQQADQMYILCLIAEDV